MRSCLEATLTAASGKLAVLIDRSVTTTDDFRA